jgi:hypothetical protein
VVTYSPASIGVQRIAPLALRAAYERGVLAVDRLLAVHLLHVVLEGRGVGGLEALAEGLEVALDGPQMTFDAGFAEALLPPGLLGLTALVVRHRVDGVRPGQAADGLEQARLRCMGPLRPVDEGCSAHAAVSSAG